MAKKENESFNVERYTFAKFIQQSNEQTTYSFTDDELGDIESSILTAGVDNFKIITGPMGVENDQVIMTKVWSINTIADLPALFKEFIDRGKTIYLYSILKTTAIVGDGSYEKIKIRFGEI